MCRGFQPNGRERLTIKAFATHLSASSSNAEAHLPNFLTLHYLPRINGSTIEVNGSGVRSDSPAFLTLHRVLSKQSSRGAVYASRESVAVCEGVKFEIYVGDAKVLKGTFRKVEGEQWKMDCKLDEAIEGVRDAEVSVAAEGQAAVMSEKLEMVADGRRRRRRRRCCELEEIPEEREEGECGSDACRCCECSGVEETERGDYEEEVEDLGMESVRWALDVGIWVACLGVGYLVSKASLRKNRFI